MKKNKYLVRIKRRTAIILILWTFLVLLSYFWNVSREGEKVLDLAQVEARANLNKDRAFRLWASKKGGLYIVIGPETHPNPFLAHIPDRDITSQYGQKLTLINPATVLREVGEQFAQLYGTKAKITGEIFFNPTNKPDQWELEAMDKFRKNRELEEIIEPASIGGKRYLRMMQPMYMEESCLKCHAITGIKVGELRGATGVSIPLEPYEEIENDTMEVLIFTHVSFLVCGSILILVLAYRSGRYEDIRVQTESELRKLSYAVEQSASSVMITDTQGVIEYVNPKFSQVTGYESIDVLGKKPNILKYGETSPMVYKEMWGTLLSGREWHGEFKNRKKNGEVFWSMESISPLKDEKGNITHFVAMLEDINDRKMSEAMILRLAYYDPLTDLPNRRSFKEQLEYFSNLTNRAKCILGLFYIDLDRFKSANDTLGHLIGDELLKIMANRISESLRSDDMVFRLGGDEFAVIASNLEKSEDAMILADKIIEAVSQPVLLQNNLELYITTSIGISLYPIDTYDLEALVRNADIALYHAKEKGKNTYQFYSEKINALSLEHLQIENDLRRAIEREELFIMYQPQIDLASGKVTGVEALLRWQHPVLGLVPPDRFIPIAEETNLILPIGEWVMRNAVFQLAEWDKEGVFGLSVAINLSAVQFRRDDLLDTIIKNLSMTQVAFNRIELEITESALMIESEKAGVILKSLKTHGLSVTIDDFGTGYSSLNYLKHFPVNILKIDRSFVIDIAKNKEDQAIVGAIVSLAKGMKLKVIAEGVETSEQFEILMNLGCDNIQGYYFSKPLMPSGLKEFISKLNYSSS